MEPQAKEGYNTFGVYQGGISPLVNTYQGVTGLVNNRVSDPTSPTSFVDGQLFSTFSQEAGTIYSVKNSFTDTRAGYRLGFDITDRICKFLIGNATNFLFWNGDTLEIQGTFNIGGTTITIDNTENIQEYLDIIDTAGGGTLYLQNGTYTLTSDISIPSGVLLKGVSRDGVIIDCNLLYKVQVIGSDSYNTGTITIANGDDEVVGSGTTFTSGMVGRFILLGEDGDYQWYEITGFTDTTHIDIGSPYTGTSLAGDTFTIATTNTAAGLSTLTITNATAAGLKVQYAMEPNLNDLYIYDCGTGMDFDQVVYPLIYVSLIENGINWDANEVSGYEVNFSSFDDSTSGAGIVFNKVGTATFLDSSIRGNAGDGINMTNCSFNAMVAMDVSANGGQGIELVSNCNDNQFIAVGTNNNASDGYKFTATSDRNVISNSTVKDNGGYGVNIAAASCDGNIIISPAFSNNSSGNINDAGTGTIINGDDTAYGSSWNSNLGTPTKNAIYDKIETMGGGTYTVGALENNFVKTYFNVQLLFILYTGETNGDTDTSFTNWDRNSATDVTITTGGAMSVFGSTGSAYLFLSMPFLVGGGQLSFSNTNIVILDWWAELSATNTGDVNMGFGTAANSFEGAWNDTSGNGSTVKFAQKSTGELMAVIAEEGVGVTSLDISSGLTLTNRNNYRIELDLGNEAKFYVNGVLKATLSGANLEVNNVPLCIGFGRSDTAAFTVTAPMASLQMNP